MILFSIATAALVFIALLFLLPPLLGKARDRTLERKTAAARKALESADGEERKQIAEDLLTALENEKNQPGTVSRAGAAIVALLVPLVALGMYAWLGSPNLINGAPAAQTASDEHRVAGMTMAEAIAKLEQRLAENPDNAEGWYMLARSYTAQQRFDKAAEAMGRVLALEGENDPGLLLQYADTLAMANDGRVAGKPAEYVNKALALKPDHPEALWLAGIAESQNDRVAEAIVHWRKAVALLDDQPEAQAELRQQIVLAEQKLESMGKTIPTAESSAPTATKTPDDQQSGTAIRVTVRLAPEMAAKASPNDTVFIYARAAAGPPMPLAATRTTVADLPLTVTLDDSQAMMPQMQLSKFPRVVVGARISKSGQAIPQPGDLEGVSQPLTVRDTPEVEITIDKTVQ